MSLKVAATVQDSVSQSVVSVHDGLVSPGILLEMQILRAYPRTTESKARGRENREFGILQVCH